VTVDVVVVGLGAMGSAALYHLARRGRRVIGIERFTPGHDRGSSHGETRAIRLSYFEHPSYVPLVRAALARWHELQSLAGEQLVDVTGVLEIGLPASELITGTLQSARAHRLPHEVLHADEVMRRYPSFRLPRDYLGVLQPDGGYILAEAAIRAHVTLAKAAGAEIRLGEAVRDIAPRAGGVRIDTEAGAIDAGAVVVCAGPWIASLLPSLPPLRVTRQVLAWFDPLEPALFARSRFPVFLLESPFGVHYGFPLLATTGLKIAKHHHRDQAVDPEGDHGALTSDDENTIRSALEKYLPGANGPLRRAKTCLYTMTSDGDFIIDKIDGDHRVIFASACSGHGFKFAPVIGEILADLATNCATSYDISRFATRRFNKSEKST
jgi:sarcosine oxidase